MGTYTNRLNALSTEKTYVLSDTGIGDGTGEWSYEELTEVHLKFAPTRYHGGIYECRISSGIGSVVLSNRRYMGLADFEYNNEGFTAFVRELHKRLEHVPNVHFRTGKPKGKFIFEVAASAIFFPLMLWPFSPLVRPLLPVLFCWYCSSGYCPIMAKTGPEYILALIYLPGCCPDFIKIQP